MTTFTIEQIKGMVGMVISRIEAKVTKVWDRRTGEGEYGPWSFQDGEIQDSTGSIKITFSNLPDQRALMSKTMIFKSMETNKGLKGLEMKLSKEYKGKQDKVLQINKTALIVSNGEEPNVTLAQPSTRMPQIDAGEPVEPSIKHEDRKLGIATAKNRLTQLAGLYDLCWKTVEGMELYHNSDASLEEEYHKDIATTLFIQGVREGLADKMPVRTAEKFYKEGVQESPVHESQKGYDPDRENDDIPF